jgi:hypothetical protein
MRSGGRRGCRRQAWVRTWTIIPGETLAFCVGWGYGGLMRRLILLRMVLLLALLTLAGLWLTRVVDDVSGPVLLLCPLLVLTYRLEVRHAAPRGGEGQRPHP